MRRGATALLLTLAAGTACAGHASSGLSPGDVCNGPEPTPIGLGAAPYALDVFDRVAKICIVVDGTRVWPDRIATIVGAAYVTESHELAPPGPAVSLPPVTSVAWIRYGVASAVASRLAELEASADPPTVPNSAVRAAVASCREVSRRTHTSSSPCTESEMRRELVGKAENERIRNSGLTPSAWLTAQLRQHHVYISGIDLDASDLPGRLRPPGCAHLEAIGIIC